MPPAWNRAVPPAGNGAVAPAGNGAVPTAGNGDVSAAGNGAVAPPLQQSPDLVWGAKDRNWGTGRPPALLGLLCLSHYTPCYKLKPTKGLADTMVVVAV